jgi:hypothetical protein
MPLTQLKDIRPAEGARCEMCSECIRADHADATFWWNRARHGSGGLWFCSSECATMASLMKWRVPWNGQLSLPLYGELFEGADVLCRECREPIDLRQKGIATLSYYSEEFDQRLTDWFCDSECAARTAVKVSATPQLLLR